MWLSTIPPILFVLVFKIYLNHTFQRAFQYYIPTEEQLRVAHVHSTRSDNAGNKLEKRFGHPALHMELYTPMVHAHMTQLLPEVFHGKISNVKAKLDDFGGSKVDASVVMGGVKIAGIEEVRSLTSLLSSLHLNTDVCCSATSSTIHHYIAATVETTGTRNLSRRPTFS